MPHYLGQHFLKNTAVVKKIITTINPRAGETIIEIGPGHGALTIPLIASCKAAGAKIIAIEKDNELATALLPKFAAANIDAAQIIPGDILEFLKSPETQSLLSAGIYKIVGNIPYYLTGHLLRIVSELPAKPECAVIMIQKEVAERIIAEPPRMNRLAASVQFWAEANIIAQVPRRDFTPPPEVDSAVIALTTKKNADYLMASPYYNGVRVLFAQPRKTILNNLAEIGRNSDRALGSLSAEISKNDIVAALGKLNIDPNARPQDLTIEKIIAIVENILSVHK